MVERGRDIGINYVMLRLNRMVFIILIVVSNSCGTAKGVLYGTGTVLEGMAVDARAIGNWLE